MPHPAWAYGPLLFASFIERLISQYHIGPLKSGASTVYGCII
ncbi:hypothetical protein BIFDEN_01292 [Bifidobacterium dentium ATCC 27678]|nr:hypothetical protein BIFDEN_01292 [Bifidobacterium dentium ATCC 27678]